ncbi:SsrA-binding protein [Candidatus Phytoplasma pruni]|uniref:SsrA-binding protein n=1 Tax=Candidatus Phytoplasma pruni TaxID=479893 RepID=A0A0M1MZS3_9MOLU|nr:MULTISPECIES: SsrA-binding protein SmpB [16SrIII (X-disease group)]KOR75391.1 SsrA-binding protein [Candidatus Phytoplasma pruni]MCQ9618854.1 SsrA-binding protein SmpB [Candidatus Phytoplasma pruni]MDW3617748.1 SsrA-binding protein SmpB [Candidatus Phytoplasma pruni]WEK82568.1 MAG: SsrA-binding protein [Candidatus Phytoplasma pruni]
MKKTVILNKKISYDYFLDKKYCAGIKLLGNEVKSIRLGKVNLDSSYIYFVGDELFVYNMKIAKYDFSNNFDFEENRKKKLLLKKQEILQIKSKIKLKNFSVIPIKLFLIKNLFKLEFALAQGKKKYDKRADLKKKDDNLRIKKTLKYSEY